jgi:hypothetical protein
MTESEPLEQDASPRSRLQQLPDAKVQLTCDRYAISNRPSNRTAILLHLEHTFYGLAIILVGAKMQSDRYPLNHKHPILRLYLPYHVCIEPILVEGNLTRCQRAFEGAE